MTLAVTVSLRLPVLRTALERIPGLDVTIEGQTTTDGPLDVTLRAYGEEAETFEDGLDADPSVSRWVPLGGVEGARLYRVRFSAASSPSLDFHGWTDGKGVFLPAERDGDGWRVTAYFPERSVLRAFVTGCESNDVRYVLLNVSDDPRLGDTGRFSLSDVQAETLRLAYDSGYYSVPRETTLADLAVRLGVSHQALSERLRRAVGSLVEHTLASRSLADRSAPDDSDLAPSTAPSRPLP